MLIENAIKNAKSTIILYLSNYLLKFAVRYVFVNILPVNYLGLNTLLNDILMLLCVTEMGIGTAIVYSLYKPLSVNDFNTVKAIMYFFKNIYRRIGCIIFCFGLIMLPFFDFFIKDNNIPEAKLYFLIFLIIDAGGYFFSYKWSLLIADQKQYIYNYYRCIFLILLSVLQIVFLTITRNYWSFVLILLFVKFLECYYISSVAEKIYPFLRRIDYKTMPLNIKDNILKNTKALVLNKITNVLGSSSIGILISKYIGLSIVGIYSNYSLIIGALFTFCSNTFYSISANIGNLLTFDDEVNKIKIFKFLLYIAAWGASNIFPILNLVLNDLICLWIGSDMLLERTVVILLLLSFYFDYMQIVVRLFKESAGLYWQERYRPVLEIIFIIFLSLILVNKYGLIGIILGNLIAKLLTSFWIEPYILFSGSLKYSIKRYFEDYFKYSSFVFIISVANFFFFSDMFIKNILITLFVKCILGFICINFLWIVIFGKKDEFIYLRKIILKILQ